MKRCRNFYILTAIFTISAICLSYIFQNSDVDSVTGATVVNEGKETTSGTWAEYEYMRLRNPHTGEIPRNINRKQEEFAQTLPTVESRRAKKSKKEINNYAYGWKSRGPHNIGGRTRALGIDIRNENIILAGGVSGGMWKSTDNGATWRKTTNSYQLHNISCLVQDTRPGHEDTWYYGTGEMSGGHDEARAFVPYRGDGIFKSTDNGDSWELLESTSTDRPEAMDQNLDWTWKMAIDPSNLIEDEVYVAAHGAIYRSINGGETWNVVLGGTGQAQIYTDVAVTSNGVVYAALCFGSAQGLYRSDNGINWTNITPTGWPSFFNRVLIAVAPSNENSVYFFTETTPTWAQSVYNGTYAFWKYRYISGSGTGEGCEWENRSSSMFHNYAGVGFCMLLCVYPENEDVVILGRQSMHRSRDGFRTSNAIDLIGDANGTFFEEYGLHCDHHAMVFSPTNPKVAYTANDGGVAKTMDITSPIVEWTSLEYGYITSQYYTVAIPDIEDDPRIMGGMHDNGTYITESFNQTEHWNYLMSGDGAYAVFVDGGSRMITSWQEGNSYIGNRVPNNPNDWVWTRINPSINNVLFINPIAVDPNDDNVVYMAGGYQLLRCSDITNIPLDGSNSNKPEYWQAISGGGWSQITAIGISKQPASIVYYGTIHGGLYKLENALSDSPVRTVLSISGTGLPGNAYVSNIAVHPHYADHIVVTYANYEVRSIFASNNGGSTWEDVSGNLEENSDGSGSGPAVNWAAILPEDGGNTYFVGTSVGLFSTRNLNGLNTIWVQEGPEIIGNVNVKMVVTRESDREVAVATYGNGIFSRDFSVTGVDDKTEIPYDFALYQNYPNPFNPTTTIKYHLPHTTNVEIIVYDMLGREIKTLVNQELNAGYHEITWDSTNKYGKKVTSGLYIYRMQADNFVNTKKLMLLK